jgi:hypothetical protein
MAGAAAPGAAWRAAKAQAAIGVPVKLVALAIGQ